MACLSWLLVPAAVALSLADAGAPAADDEACEERGGECGAAAMRVELLQSGAAAVRAAMRADVGGGKDADTDWWTTTTTNPQASCSDTSGDATGKSSKTCGFYDSDPTWCPLAYYYDDSDWTATLMCCACGGGWEASCTDTSGDATGKFSKTCDYYRLYPTWCTLAHYYDDSDWTAADMCCACGGGAGVTCADTDDGASDSYADTCADYVGAPSLCTVYDDEDFTSSDMCCACGGGGNQVTVTVACVGDSSSWDAGYGGCDTYGPGTDNNPFCDSDSYNGVVAEDVCYQCGSCVSTCADTDDGATDSYGDSCALYVASPAWCNGYDDGDFTSSDMCCACGGGDQEKAVKVNNEKEQKVVKAVPLPGVAEKLVKVKKDKLVKEKVVKVKKENSTVTHHDIHKHNSSDIDTLVSSGTSS